MTAPDAPLRVGSAIHGFANGYFGRDSYACRFIEAEGGDWFVTRNTRGEVEFITKRDAAGITDPEDRAYCEGERGDTCVIPPVASSAQNQTVVVTHLADRHADLHGRDHAVSAEFVVPAGDLRSVLVTLADGINSPVGRYSITVSEPWDAEADR